MTTQIRGGSDLDLPAAAPADTVTNLVGEVVDGRYRLEAIIGEGGMGRVYRAEHVRLQRSVAVKVLHAHWSRIHEVTQRFEREAVAVARLDHPNCVSVQDFGRLADGALYLVMPFLAGQLLSDALRAGRLNERRALGITRHVLSGLAHAHKAGIVHRDIKTANIMLVESEDDADVAKILDFGIAKVLDPGDEEPEGERLTVVGQRFGTPAYMSPEQSIGKAVDLRTDLYSTAVVLFELLTGGLPFESSDNLELMGMQAGAPPPTLAKRVPGVDFPDELEALVARGLAKDPAARFASASDFKAAVDAYERAQLPVAPGAQPRRRWGRLARRLLRRVPRKVWLGLAGALLVGTTVLLALRLRAPTRVDHAAHAQQLLGEGKPEQAVAYLEQHRKDIGDDPRARLELGHAYAAVRRYDDALAAYAHAQRAAPSLGDDRTMRTNLMLMLEDERSDIAANAARFLVEVLQDDGARARIVELASRNASLTHRARMRDVAEQLGLGERIDRLTSYRLDLQQDKTCPDRQRAIAKLRALGDPAAIPALDKALLRRTNACLRADAADAKRYLEAQAQAEPSED